MPATPFGKYLLLDAIAQGGMASIHRAVLRGEAGFQKIVALKRVLPVLEGDKDITVLFQDEARIASLLGHANICQVFDFGQVNGELYMTMELVEGTDVVGLVMGGPLPIEATLFLCSDAARGLGHAHDQKGQDGRPLGLVHRDVSPQNILVSRAGDVKITDFGIAKALGKAHRTASGVVLGKLHYMSPEQLAGGPVDQRADIFSLGVILWELLTGEPLRPPRAKDAPPPRPEDIHPRDPEPPSSRNPQVPPELDAICLRALARRRDERIPRAAELARELGRILHQRNPGYGREDFGALVSERVPPLPPVEIPPEAANPPTAIDAAAHRQLDLETRSVAPSQRHRRWRRLSASAWLGVFFGVIIVVSMTIVVFRVLLPGTDEPIAVVPDAAPPDAAPRAPDAGGDLGTPFTLVPRATADEERVLGEAVRGWDVARRGTPTDDYTTFLSALDHRIALLQLDGAGRPMAPAPLPPTLIVRLGPNLGAVDAVMRYVEATGKLPRGVADALRSFLANYPAFVRAETLAVGVRLPAYSAAALSVWLSPKDPRRLAVLAVANEWLGRWCEPIGVPTSRWFAPVLCDRDTLLAALPPGDATAAAFARWDAALDEATVGGVTLRARDPEQSAGDRSGEDILSLVVETVPDASYALVAGVLPGERAPRTQAAEGAVTRLSFRVPPAIFKPVLIVRHAGETFELRIGRPR